MTPYLTVFTPAYNRAHTLGRLYDSLKGQTCLDFEWLVVDDGSTDGTAALLKGFEDDEGRPFPFAFVTVKNGGKPRAINRGVEMANGKFFFLIDSDDYIVPDAIEKVIRWCREIENDDSFIGVGGARCYPDGSYIKGVPPTVNEKGYVDATNLERPRYNLDADMCEAYRLDLYRKFPYMTWEGENFAPEEITMNEIALNGYRLRWHSDRIYICEYLPGGLTRSGLSLGKRNPMGYAMMYNHRLKCPSTFKQKLYNAMQMTAQSIFGRHPGYIFKSNAPLATLLTLPLGLVLSIRRFLQHRKV